MLTQSANHDVYSLSRQVFNKSTFTTTEERKHVRISGEIDSKQQNITNYKKQER